MATKKKAASSAAQSIHLNKSTDQQRQEWVATAAYYRAQARGFQPGHELADWLDAEREVTSRLGGH